MLSSLVIKALLALGAVLVAWGLWHGFTGHYVALGVAKQQAKDAPIVASLAKQRDQAIAANASLSASVDKLQADVSAAHQAWVALNAAQQTQEASAKKAIAAAHVAAGIALDQVRKLAALAATPDDEAQAAQCAEGEAILADYATWRRGLH